MPQSLLFQPPLPEIDYSQIDVISLLKEKVRLEGQLEMVEAEAKQAIKDRADLQTQVSHLSWFNLTLLKF